MGLWCALGALCLGIVYPCSPEVRTKTVVENCKDGTRADKNACGVVSLDCEFSGCASPATLTVNKGDVKMQYDESCGNENVRSCGGDLSLLWGWYLAADGQFVHFRGLNEDRS